MKPIKETHPSLKTTTSGFGWKVAIDIDIQRATIDKQVLKEKLDDIKQTLSEEDGCNIIDWEKVYKELGLDK